MGTQANGNPVAGWLTIAVAILVLTIAIYSISSDHHDAANSIPTTDSAGEYVPDEVKGLLSFVDSMAERGGTVGGHEYAAAGVRYVASALGSVANAAGLNVDAELETIRECATRIERDPRPRERAVQARAAFISLATLFEALQQARFHGLEPDVANVSRAALSFRANFRLADQNDVVREFFNRAASTIRTMNHAMSSPGKTQVIRTA